MSRTRDDDFDAFVHARSAALHRAAYLMVGEQALAQDLVQEALVKTYAAWPRLRDKTKAEAYCRKAITTTAISWFRRRRWTHERVVGALPDVPAVPASEELAARVTRSQWLWQALQALPVRQRAAVVLRYYEDLTEAQTAAAMGCAVGTVKSQTAAAILRLREVLGDDDPDLLPLTDADRTVKR